MNKKMLCGKAFCLLAGTFALAVLAADPVWPPDFEQRLAERIEAIRDANTNVGSPASALDARANATDVQAFGTAVAPFDSFYRTEDFSLPSKLITTEPRGLYIYIR